MLSGFANRVTCAVVLAALAVSSGFADPPPVTPLTSANSSFTQEQIGRIREFASFWADLLNMGPHGDVRRVKQKLIEPLRAPGVTEVFRDEYSRQLAPELAVVVEKSDPHRAVNAMIVLANLGTEDAMDVMLDHCDVRGEPRPMVRMWAARGFTMMLEQGRLEVLKGKKVATMGRQLRQAIGDETDRFAIRQQLLALQAADRPSIPADTRRKVREHLVESMNVIADRAARAGIEKDEQPLLLSVFEPMRQMRTSLLDPARGFSEQREFGRMLGPSLAKVLDVARAHWQDAQGEPDLKAEYGELVRLAELFLGTIDGMVRPDDDTPVTTLADAWDDNDAKRFAEDLGRWQSVLGRPPY